MDGAPFPPVGFCSHPRWLLPYLAILFGQIGLSLNLYGPNWQGLTNDLPILSGRHPLHLYHGWLGASTFHERWSTTCYDPAFQAGYPKTPVFDGGCRPAEACLILLGYRHPERSYKLGILAVCVLVPVIFAASARTAGLPAPAACIAAVLGIMIWWSPRVRAMLDAGNVDLLLAGLMAIMFLGGLIRYHHRPGVQGWMQLSIAAAIGWYAHPVVWLGLVPILVAYYLYLAPRHGLAWHLGLLGITAAGLTPNLWWLWDWGRFWWLRQPSVDDVAPWPPLQQLLGSLSEYTQMIGTEPVGWAVLVLGGMGLIGMTRCGWTVAAATLLIAAAYALLVARLGQTWPTLQVVAADRVAPFASAVLVTPAAFLLWNWWCQARHGRWAVIVISLMPAVLGWGGTATRPMLAGFAVEVHPFRLGLSDNQLRIVQGLQRLTTPQARILVEDHPQASSTWNWTALLGMICPRYFLGGLDSEACVEHAFCQLRGGRLNGRLLADWTLLERQQFSYRYNLGWVLCRSEATAAWWLELPGAQELARFHDEGPVILLELNRTGSYILQGTATLERLNRHEIVLVDAVPNEAGELILSLHHQPGFRITPAVARVESDPDPFDPIPMLKLWLPGPISRIVLRWENP